MHSQAYQRLEYRRPHTDAVEMGNHRISLERFPSLHWNEIRPVVGASLLSRFVTPPIMLLLFLFRQTVVQHILFLAVN